MKRYYMNDQQRSHYQAWAQKFGEDVRAETGYVEGNIYHLWHGDIRNRRTLEAYEGLRDFQFDPIADIAISMNGSWRWNTQKFQMHNYVSEHFALRREDG
jgi:hypothetical protein